MVLMVKAINKSNFGGRQNVTCWTCHRGVSEPAVTPALDAIYSEPVITPPDILKTATNGVPTADQIFDKYIQAIGGAANLAKLTSWTAKGTAISFGTNNQADPAEIYAKAPNQYATIINQPGGVMERMTDGSGAWSCCLSRWSRCIRSPTARSRAASWMARWPSPRTSKNSSPHGTSASPTPSILPRRIRTETSPKRRKTTSGWCKEAATLRAWWPRSISDKQSGLLLAHGSLCEIGNGPRVPTQIDWRDYRPVGRRRRS